MTASALLADLCQRGVSLRLSEDRLRILIPKEALTPDLRESLLAVKPQLIRLIELSDQYRQLLREAFAADTDIESWREGDRRRRFGEEQARLVDELGPTLAATVATMEARAWRADTGCCPTCEGDGQCQECGREPED